MTGLLLFLAGLVVGSSAICVGAIALLARLDRDD